MIQSLHTAASGMKAQQTKIDTIANNLSNVSTVGYKQKNVNFKDALYQTMQNPEETGRDNNLQKGYGVLLSSITKDLTGGSIIDTGRMLDFAINGQGYFAVETNEGTKYTRAGNFYTSEENGTNYLVTANGNYVLDNDLNRITVDDEKLSSEIGVYGFINPEGLSEEGNNLYVETATSGVAQNVTDTNVIQRAIESSNVDMTDQLTDMIKAQRAYQAASRLVSISDEMEGMANNLRR